MAARIRCQAGLFGSCVLKHYVYLVRCADDSLYTGYSTDVMRRVRFHNTGKGAKYTRSRLPVELVAHWEYPDKGTALSAEYRLRHMPRARKLRQAQLLAPP